MTQRRWIASAAAFAALSAPAFADNPSGAYLGGGWGRFNLHIENLNDVGQAVSTIVHSHDNAWQLFVGYRFNPYIALEAAYLDLGNAGDQFTATGSSGHYKVHVDGFAPALIGSLPLGPVELFVKGGYYYYNVNLTVDTSSVNSASVESSHRRENFLYGGGIGITFFDHVNVRAEYDEVDLQNYHNSEAIWLLGSYRF